MSKLITIPIDFITIEDLIIQYQNNLTVNSDNLGIIADQRSTPCRKVNGSQSFRRKRIQKLYPYRFRTSI
jgi:hypothetical protein